jgi:hypothetical protein
MQFRTNALALTVPLGLILAIGCHHVKPSDPVAPMPLREQHCWWAVNKTAYPLDTVVNRFTRALVTVGFPHPRTSRAGDTAWVNAGQAPLPLYAGRWAGARVVGYQSGDSTHYRIFVAMPDSSESGPISLCQRISVAAPVAGVTLREPDGEEKMSVWRSRR